MPTTVFPVLLAGGASSRLWPVSDHERPKWDLQLFGDQNLLQMAWVRGCAVASPERALVVAGEAHAARIRACLPDLPEPNLLVEPGLRDTAGAVAYAAGFALKHDPAGALLVLPGDQLIDPLARFETCARTAVAAAMEHKALVTFGIVPDNPATGYGYIHRGAALAVKDAPAGAPKAFRVASFTEKPDLATARKYVEGGQHFWNGGIFVFPLEVLMAELDQHLPAHAAMARALAESDSPEAWAACAKEHYAALVKKSIDFGIMEHAKTIVTVAADFNWDDIGSWKAIRRHYRRPEEENAAGPGVQLDALHSRENIVLAPGRRVALIGVENLAVIDDREGLLILHLDHDQAVKEVAARKPAVEMAEVTVPSQGRKIDALYAVPPQRGPETGFMLVIHGFGNNRYQYRDSMERWAARYNVVCVSPEYRDSGLDSGSGGERGYRQPYDYSHLQVMDALNAYRAARLAYPQCDGRRSYVWGGSQGGHIAVLATCFAPGTFALTIDACGPAYVADARRERLGAGMDEAGLQIRDARNWVGRVGCPVLLIHGTADETVPHAHTQELAQALLDQGRDVTVRFIHGGDHFLRPVSTRERVTEEAFDLPLRHARRETGDDFELAAEYELACPNGVVYHVDFRSGLATINRRAKGGKA